MATAPRRVIARRPLCVSLNLWPTVTQVNTLNRDGKRRRNRRTGTWGKRPDTKRAFVTLAEGDSIELFGC